MDVSLKALVRNFDPRNWGADDEQELNVIMGGELLVAQGLPHYAASAMLGGINQVKLTTGLAANTSLPTTTAGLSLYNNEVGAGGVGVCYFILAFGSNEEVIDATQADTTTLLAMMNIKSGISSIPANAGLAIQNLSGRTYGGAARTISGATVINDGWFAHAPAVPLASAVAAANWKNNEAVVDGMYMVPPGGQFNITAVKAAAAAAAQQFYYIRWLERVAHYKA